MKKIIALMLVFTAVFFTACSESEAYRYGELPGRKMPFRNHTNAVILHWNKVAQEVMSGPAYNPMIGSRIMAMVNIAIHDALNNIAPVYETYAYHESDRKADPIAAVASAAYTVLLESFPDKKDHLDEVLADALKNLKSSDGRQRGILLGERAGKAIVVLRSGDGAFADPIAEVDNPLEPGLFQAVPPMPIMYAPFWADMMPFALTSPAQFRTEPLPGLTSDVYTRDFNEVKEVGVKHSTTRTADQTAIAKYWYEFSEIGWNRVTAIAVTDAKLDLLSTARVFALVSMGLADAYTAGWDSKFHYNFWRPYTAIRAAATDGNPGTSEDAAWEPLMDTPPIHDYPSTHSALGNASATILASLLGTNTGFTMTSPTADPAVPTRSFNTFGEAALENAESRILAGIHFRFSCERGLDLGKRIGEWILDNQLKPRVHVKNL
jgi:hypothetical protein